MAARAGKDIWCERPMTRTVGEGKRVMEYVKSKGRMFRLNTWCRFKGPFYGFGTPVKPVRQVVENGLLGNGPIRCVFGAGQGFSWKFYWSGKVNLPVEKCPETFDWDMWLGPAPYKPYSSHRAHGTFRGYWDYDAGGLGDMAQHYLDPLQYLLCKDETSPVRVDYVGPKQHPDVVGRFDRITLTYADGTEVILDGDESLKDEPFLRGSNGVTVWPCRAPDGKVRTWTKPEEAKGQMFGMKDADGKDMNVRALLAELKEPEAQQTVFMDSVRTRKRFCLNEETGFRSATMFNLAIVAERLGRGFEFDPVSLRAKNDPAADRFLYQSMRQPWLDEFLKA
jgi:predicted dehydrogenase